MARKTISVETAEIPAEAEISAPRAVEPTPQIPPHKKTATGFLGGVLTGLLCGGAGFAAAQYWPLNAGAVGGDQIAALQSDLAAIKAEIAQPAGVDPAQAARLDAIEAALKSIPAAPDLTALTNRIAAIEAQPAVSATALSALEGQLSALKSQSNPVDAAALVKSAIAAEMNSVASAAATLRDQSLDAAKSAQTAAAITQLRAALDTGAPFGSVVDSPNFPAILTPYAATGLPSQTALIAGFPDAARAALEAALLANMGETWSERVTNFLRNQTGARALAPREGSDPDAILSRAEAALNAADLPTVLTEIAALPPQAQTAMQTWTDMAKLRQSAIQAVADFAKAGE